MSETPDNKASALLNLKFEDAPPFGAGTMPVESEKPMVMLAHLFAIIIWFWKRKESPAVDAHGKEALNFGITYILLVGVPLQILTMVLPVAILWLVFIVVTIVGLAALALVIIAMIKAREGKLLRYPINLRLIK